MKIASISNPRWLDEAHTGIVADVTFDMSVNVKIAATQRLVNDYVARPTDLDTSLWQDLNSGLYGPIAEHTG